MRRVALLIALSSAASASAYQGHIPDAQVLQDCGTCHGIELTAFQRDVHAAVGMDCTSCHGGSAGSLDADEAHGDALRALTGAREAVDACGACHADQERMRVAGLRTDQLSLYWTSGHGRKLAEDGDAPVATCVSCHGGHGILRSSDPRSSVHPFRQPETCGSCHADAERMGPFGLSSEIVDEYRASVHGVALVDQGHLSAPACADCHGSHGAMPPGVADIEMVCGNCHSMVQQAYERSVHFTGALSAGSVECATCHSEHAVAKPSAEMFVGDDEGRCGSCHMEADDPGSVVGAGLRDLVEQFGGSIVHTEETLRAAGKRGLYLGDERAWLDEARALLVRARAETHAVDLRSVSDVLVRGDALIERTHESLEVKGRSHRDRRIVTAIFFMVSIAFAIVLLMYARLIRGRGKSAPTRAAASGGEPHAG